MEFYESFVIEVLLCIFYSQSEPVQIPIFGHVWVFVQLIFCLHFIMNQLKIPKNTDNHPGSKSGLNTHTLPKMGNSMISVVPSILHGVRRRGKHMRFPRDWP